MSGGHSRAGQPAGAASWKEVHATLDSARVRYVHWVDARELERKARVAELLLEAARELSESVEPERVYDRFHELLADVLPHDGIVVSSYEEQEGLIRCEYAWSDGNRLDVASFPALPLNREGGGMQSRTIVSGEPLVFNDVAERVRDPGGTYYDVDREGTIRKLPESGPPGTHAAMMVPVKQDGRVVGVVQVMSDREEYSTAHLELVEGLVGQMAAAVRNARLQKERRRLEAAEAAARAIAAEREQAASVLEAVGDGIFLVDGDSVVRLWNRAAELVTGLRSDGVRGRPVAEVFPTWEALVGRIPVTDDGATARPATVPADVEGRELWLSFVAVRHGSGVVYAFRDVSVERRLDEDKSDFIATVSHELRTPMAAVHGAAQTLLRTDVELTPDQQRELLAVIVSQAARLADITEEVLLATQLDRGTLVVHRTAGRPRRVDAVDRRCNAVAVSAARGRPRRGRGRRRRCRGSAGPDSAGAREPARQRRQVRAPADHREGRGR
jgi:PAS domain S-box-containing protein